ncbi:MAG: fatty acyl-AMP ligase [Gammaproteobacteria bacterium]
MNQDATSTNNDKPQRLADFETLTEALDYAASGVTGCNFYTARGELQTVLPYRELRERALISARRFLQLGLQRGDHVALVADTGPDFIILFFACRYAGLVPFAMPVPVNLGSHQIYVQQLRGLLEGGQAVAALASMEFIGFLEEASEGLQRCLRWVGTPQQLATVSEADAALQSNHPNEPAYLQFTSGSTRFPQGVVISEQAVMSNLQGIVRTGLCLRPGDRSASWLPFYHDMGLVGFVLGPIVSQVSVDYMRTRDFAVRPVQWLRLISRNRCSIAFSPPFGLELCARRVRSADIKDLDLSSWRAAGIGAEMIRPAILDNFAQTLAPAGFNPQAFLPCYGLAEASLAVTFSELDQGVEVMCVDALELAERGIAVRVQTQSRKANEFVNCGHAFPGHEIAIVDDEDNVQPDLRVGRVMVRGPSVMSSYLNDPEATREVLSPEGWLDTGDLGYVFEGNLYLTGRRKDIIIVNGRNIRAQDLEALAEAQAEVRMGDASAFEVADNNGHQTIILVVECRISDTTERQSLIVRLQRLVYEGFGIHCLVEVAPLHTLPRTSSGKLSRAAAREGFMERADWSQATSVQAGRG